MTPTDEPKLWTIPDVAEHLGISQSTVRAYLARDQMPAPDMNLGNKPVWLESKIRAWRG